MIDLEDLNAEAWACRKPFIEWEGHLLRAISPTLMRDQMAMTRIHAAILEMVTYSFPRFDPLDLVIAGGFYGS